MRIIDNLLKHLEAAAVARERAAEEAYLADATDIYDVEARMREWDRMHSANYDLYQWQVGQRPH